MIDVTEFTQGDYTFYIRPMEPFKSLDLLGDLQKTILPTIGAALGKVDDETKKEEITFANMLNQKIDIKAAFDTFAQDMNGTKLKNYMERILDLNYISYSKYGSSDAKKMDKAALLEIYTGNIKNMFGLAWEVLKVNYKDFFSTLPTQFGEAIESKSL